MEKDITLFNLIADFKAKDNPTITDWLPIFIIFSQCNKRGNGLEWYDIRQYLKDVGYKEV